MTVDKDSLLKATLILAPTYSMAYMTEQMVYTIPMLAVTSFLASNLSNTNNVVDDGGDSDA